MGHLSVYAMKTKLNHKKYFRSVDTAALVNLN